MASPYNIAQTNQRLAKAVEMRDSVINYCRKYIQKVNNLRLWQAREIGLQPTKEHLKQMRELSEKHMKMRSDQKRIARGKQAFSYGTTFKQNQRNRPQARG